MNNDVSVTIDVANQSITSSDTNIITVPTQNFEIVTFDNKPCIRALSGDYATFTISPTIKSLSCDVFLQAVSGFTLFIEFVTILNTKYSLVYYPHGTWYNPDKAVFDSKDVLVGVWVTVTYSSTNKTITFDNGTNQLVRTIDSNIADLSIGSYDNRYNIYLTNLGAETSTRYINKFGLAEIWQNIKNYISSALSSKADKTTVNAHTSDSTIHVTQSDKDKWDSISTDNFATKTELASKSDTSHTHDERYYTESEVDTKLNAKANSSHTHTDVVRTPSINFYSSNPYNFDFQITEVNDERIAFHSKYFFNILHIVKNRVDDGQPPRVEPGLDVSVSLGFHGNRWKDIYCANATITTSDKRAKQQIKPIDDNLLNAWENVSPVQYKFNDSVESKGDNARLHTGYIAQDIDEACKDQGVNASEYGLFCYDKWEAEEARYMEEQEEYQDGEEEVEETYTDDVTGETKTRTVTKPIMKTRTKKTLEQEARPAGDSYSLRYEEALVVECAYLRKQLKLLSDRLEKLENVKE